MRSGGLLPRATIVWAEVVARALTQLCHLWPLFDWASRIINDSRRRSSIGGWERRVAELTAGGRVTTRGRWHRVLAPSKNQPERY